MSLTDLYDSETEWEHLFLSEWFRRKEWKGTEIYIYKRKGLSSFIKTSLAAHEPACNLRVRKKRTSDATRRYDRIKETLRVAQRAINSVRFFIERVFFFAKGHGMRVYFVVQPEKGRGEKTVELQKSFRHAKMDTCIGERASDDCVAKWSSWKQKTAINSICCWNSSDMSVSYLNGFNRVCDSFVRKIW